MSAAAVQQHPEPVEHEFSTDAPACAEDFAAAYLEFLPLAEGDRTAAAVLAAGAVLAAALDRRSTLKGSRS